MTIGRGEPEAMHLRVILSPIFTKALSSGKVVWTKLGSESFSPTSGSDEEAKI